MNTHINFPSAGSGKFGDGNIGGGANTGRRAAPIIIETARAIGALASTAAFVLLIDMLIGGA